MVVFVVYSSPKRLDMNLMPFLTLAGVAAFNNLFLFFGDRVEICENQTKFRMENENYGNLFNEWSPTITRT